MCLRGSSSCATTGASPPICGLRAAAARGQGERVLNEWFSADTSWHVQTECTVNVDWIHAQRTSS